jgi:CRISPR-associated protein Csb1
LAGSPRRGTADLELFLREGCLLRYANEDTWTAVPRRGEPAKVSLPEPGQLVAYATAAYAPFQEKWPEGFKKEGDRILEHEFAPADAQG